MKRILLGSLVVSLCALLITGCAQTSGGGSVGTVSGIVYAADGTTPISGATVTANTASGSGFSALAVLGTTTTASDGAFSLEVTFDGSSANVDVSISKGAFSAVISNVSVSSGSTTTVGDASGNVVLDPNNPPPGTVVTVARMAVVTGMYDRMQDVLAKLGYGSIDSSGQLVLGTETFDLYDGDSSLPASYEAFNDLLNSPEAMALFRVIFINCGTQFESLLTNPTIVANIQDYVSNGGHLYVTDLSYDYVEQCFPQYIDFYGSDSTPTASPETMGAAEVGTSGISVDAEVLDASMSSWLSGVGALNPDGTVSITGFLSGWAVISAESSTATKIWTRGDVSFYTYSVLSATAVRNGLAAASDVKAAALTTGVRPLTVTFDHGSGQVLYSSYHTEEEHPATTLYPQEYILAYLIFEM